MRREEMLCSVVLEEYEWGWYFVLRCNEEVESDVTGELKGVFGLAGRCVLL